MMDNSPIGPRLVQLKDKVLEVDDDNYVRNWNHGDDVSRWLNETMTSDELASKIAEERWFQQVLGGHIKP